MEILRKAERTVKYIRIKAENFVEAAIKHKISTYAAQASFFISISVVPFLMFMLSMSKFLLHYFGEIGQSDLINYINAAVPNPLNTYVENIVSEVFSNSRGITYITATAALWLASKGVMSIVQGVCNVIDGGKQPNWFYARAVSVIYTLIFTILLLLVLLVFGFGDKILGIFPKIEISHRQFPFSLIEMKEVIFFAVLMLVFMLMYRFMPSNKFKLKQCIPGAALAAAGWIVFSWLYSLYIERSSYTTIYGGLATVVWIEMWLYFCMNIVLLGAEVNNAIAEGLFKKIKI